MDGRDGRGRTGRMWTGGTDVNGRDGRGRAGRTWTDVDGRDGRDGRGRTGRTWTDGTDDSEKKVITFLPKPNERNSLEILFIWTLAGRVRTKFFENSVHLEIGWACRRQIPAASTSWYVQLNGISCELRAFRTLLARVQMKIISGDFRSFGL